VDQQKIQDTSDLTHAVIVRNDVIEPD